ncbi:MAG TPA: class I SAM-dependent methyltransferase [Alphaproteobacteria bacterium]|jgi:demethylmenaquinone methyltransferase/2-methoxy-6-polyprenyl-1,4-benzoquinol methylase|nr:class I SAM-dependent methyltransferase [Alphaproteobacteria bacterium]
MDKGRDDTTYFGFRTVARGQKAALVREVFDDVAGRYDLMNDLMSGGVHRLWKAALVEWLKPRPGMHLLDVAGGTGDISYRVLDRLGGGQAARKAGFRASICDINHTMLEAGRDRALDRGIVDGVDWLCADAEALPLDDASVDAYTIAFGIRNVTDIAAALAEARRVLRPGGRFLCLEFSRLLLPGLTPIYDAYSLRVLPALGDVVTGNREAYLYLAESIRRFPNQQNFAAMITEAGLERVRVRNLSGGIAAMHSAWRL